MTRKQNTIQHYPQNNHHFLHFVLQSPINVTTKQLTIITFLELPSKFKTFILKNGHTKNTKDSIFSISSRGRHLRQFPKVATQRSTNCLASGIVTFLGFNSDGRGKFRIPRNTTPPEFTITWQSLENPLIFNRKYIDSFMVDVPASHVRFRGRGYLDTPIQG